MRRELILNGEVSQEVLRVPYFSQSNRDSYCLVFSLKMCLEYFKNIYQNRIIKRDTPFIDVQELAKITHTSYCQGTRNIKDSLTQLSDKISCLNFEVIEGANFDDIEEYFDKNLPVIVLYNCSQLISQERGPAHAGVVVGINNSHIILNNPWLGPESLIPRADFEPAWELEYKQLIIIKPNPQEKFIVESKTDVSG